MITNLKKWKRSARRRSGQTIVEAGAILVIFFIPISLGIVQFCVVLNATNSLTQIAREGGRYAAVHGTELNADAAIKDYIQAVAAGTTIRAADLPDGNITISMLTVNGLTPPRASGNAINVRIRYEMRKKIFIPNFIPNMTLLRNDYYAQSTFVLE
jgi:hypothetical protein